jgi:hypothetical protein
LQKEIVMKHKMLTVVMAGLFAGAAWAADPMKGGSNKPAAGKPTASFDQVDTNKDGVISSAEAKKDSTLSRMFKQLDRDNDGQLTQSEYDAGGSSGAGGDSPARPN